MACPDGKLLLYRAGPISLNQVCPSTAGGRGTAAQCLTVVDKSAPAGTEASMAAHTRGLPSTNKASMGMSTAASPNKVMADHSVDGTAAKLEFHARNRACCAGQRAVPAMPPPCHCTSRPTSSKVTNAGAAHTHGFQAPRSAAGGVVAISDPGCRYAAISERHCLSASLNRRLTPSGSSSLQQRLDTNFRDDRQKLATRLRHGSLGGTHAQATPPVAHLALNDRSFACDSNRFVLHIACCS